MGFASQLGGVLMKAGWQVTSHDILELGGITVGLVMSVHNLKHAPNRAVALQQALARIGYRANAQAIPGMGEDDVELFVGIKP